MPLDTLYITKEAIIKREGNTIYLVRSGMKKSIPIHNLKDIFCIARVTFTSGAIKQLLKAGVVVHFFNMYGFYEGTLYPRPKTVAGSVIINQSKFYLDWNLRKYIAIEMVSGIKHNIIRNLQKASKDMSKEIEDIRSIEVYGNSIEEIMNKEAQIWQRYYKTLDKTIRGFTFVKREYRPPTNELNALISFGNTLLYSATLTEIYHTYLDPRISYLHEPRERRFSLSLDIADIFKPTIVYRHIHNLVNHGLIKPSHFRKDFKGIFLTDEGKRIFLKEWEQRMSSTVYHHRLKRKVTQRHLLRLEAYKLMRHILGDKKYKAFRAWW